MENEGEILKNKLKGAGIEINAVADRLEMTRQNLGHHFRKQPLNKKFREKLFLAYPEIFTNAKYGENKTENGKNFTSNSFNDNDVKYLKTELQNKPKPNPRLEVTPLHRASDPDDWDNGSLYDNNIGIPMYNMPGSASNIQMYGDPNDIKIVGYLNIPGATKDSFALPVHGHSMYPTLENGSWGVVRPIEDVLDIDWGQIYYVEYGDYRVWKRLVKEDDESDCVILYSDNITEMVNGKVKYASKTIKKDRIKKLCLLTDILKKPNY